MGRGEPFGPVAETAREGEAEAPAWAERPSCPCGASQPSVRIERPRARIGTTKPLPRRPLETLAHFFPCPFSLSAAPQQQHTVGGRRRDGGEQGHGGATAGPLAGARVRPWPSAPPSSGRAFGALSPVRPNHPPPRRARSRTRRRRSG